MALAQFTPNFVETLPQFQPDWGIFQQLQPTADHTVGSWKASSGSSLYAMLDEPTASSADFIYTNAVTLGKVHLAVGSPPPTLDNIVLRLVVNGTGISYLGVFLYQGAVQKVSWNCTPPDADTLLEFPLTLADAASITDWSDLYVVFTTPLSAP